MKSTIFSLIPLVGAVLAQEGCKPKIVTLTETEKVYVTVQPVEVAEAEPTTTLYSTSTLRLSTTVTVPYASSSSLHWGNYPNGTYHNTTRVPHGSTVPTFSPIYTPVPVSETIVPTYSPVESYGQPAVSSYEAVTPTYASETPAASATGTIAEAIEKNAPAESVESTSPVSGRALGGSNSGKATFYGGNVGGGMCSFTGYTIPSGIYGTALSDSNWAGAGNCGACVSVTGPSGNKITAMVVDQCPGCGPNHLDLFSDAFAKLATPSTGVINVNWQVVPCGITTPIVLKNKEGTSQWWFSMQVMNANVPVAKLEVSTDAGKTWKATTRKEYNFFENPSGFGTATVDVKVTSVNGGVVTVKNVSIAASTTKTAGGNFA